MHATIEFILFFLLEVYSNYFYFVPHFLSSSIEMALEKGARRAESRVTLADQPTIRSFDASVTQSGISTRPNTILPLKTKDVPIFRRKRRGENASIWAQHQMPSKIIYKVPTDKFQMAPFEYEPPGCFDIDCC